MNGVGLFTLGLYTIVMAVVGGMICTGLGLIFMLFSSKRGKYD